MSDSLISPQALKQRVLKIWQRGDLHRAWLQQTNGFPLEIPLKKIAAKTLLNDFSLIQEAIYDLRQAAKKDHFLISDKIIQHRHIGAQKIPALITFKTESRLLNYLAKQKDFATFQTLAQQSLHQEPTLLAWLIRSPFKMMKFAKVWHLLLKVCAYFKQHPQPDCYLRQLDIQGVDSKFIEHHKAILNELLSEILTPSTYQANIKGLSQHGFERKYGLRYDLPLVRFRILDPSLAIHGLSDLTLPTNEFKRLQIAVETVFICENKISGLAFPDYPKALVIFGLGYSVDLLADVPCLQNRTLYYWGDIDTHGFAILSRLRHYYPHANALLMDRETLERFLALTVKEPSETAEQKPLTHLTPDENQLYQQLQQSFVRLEQERLSYAYLKNSLLGLNLER